ncbi:MAG: signal peptidase I [Gemmatimonadaceae bacterium]
MVWENFKSIAGALAIFLLIRAFLVEAYRIPSGSMIPSLLIGDWLFVNKLVYGPVIPFTDVHLPGYAEPKRGDVVVFVSPPQIDQPEDPTPTLVKRLWGTPGDTLYMRKGLLYVNGLAQPQRLGSETGPSFGGSDPNEANPLFDWQTRFTISGSRFGAAPTTPTHDEWGPLVIPAGHYMMFGDNRYMSKDSRYWGLVPRGNVRGRPIFVYYSYDPESEAFLAPLTRVRWSRLGHFIH